MSIFGPSVLVDTVHACGFLLRPQKDNSSPLADCSVQGAVPALVLLNLIQYTHPRYAEFLHAITFTFKDSDEL